MKHSLLYAAALLATTGCASIENAGFTGTKITHTPDGNCNYESADGKEQDKQTVRFNGRDCTYEAITDKARAFKGQALAVKALTILPVNDLPALLAPRDQ